MYTRFGGFCENAGPAARKVSAPSNANGTATSPLTCLIMVVIPSQVEYHTTSIHNINIVCPRSSAWWASRGADGTDWTHRALAAPKPCLGEGTRRKRRYPPRFHCETIPPRHSFCTLAIM